MKKHLLFFIILLFPFIVFSQSKENKKRGTASYYHPMFEGRKTATGDIFSNKDMTAASNHFELGQWVKVTNLRTGKSVKVLVNDRMAKHSTRIIDLTHKAAKELDFFKQGLCKVEIEKIKKP